MEIQATLPLLGTVFSKRYGGIDTGFGWLFIGAAVVALALLVLDLSVPRWGLAWGMGQALAGVAAVVAAAYNLYQYYQAGQKQILGISLLDILDKYARDAVQFSFEPGIFLAGAGLAFIIVGGLGRLLVAGFETS
jgi:hypothetical protein